MRTTTRGRHWLAEVIVHCVDRGIRGSITVGVVDELSLGRVLVHDLRFFAPDGSEVLSIPRLSFVPDPLRLLTARTLTISRAEVPRAQLTFAQAATGPLGLEAAFASTDDSGANPILRIEIVNVRFANLDSDWRLRGAPVFTINNVSGIMRLRTTEAGQPVIRFDQLRGTAAFAGSMSFVPSLRILAAAGRVRCGVRALARFDLATTLAGEPLQFELEIDEPVAASLVVRLVLGHAPRSPPLVLILQAIDALSDNMSVVDSAA